MWGKVIDIAEQWRLFGITPTHVGKRFCGAMLSPVFKDHPHPCGEKSNCYFDIPEKTGSPPPMWGKDCNQGKHGSKHRIPHPCGEKVRRLQLLYRSLGSPPPMWGKAKGAEEALSTRRITPTHVGKSYRPTYKPN